MTDQTEFFRMTRNRISKNLAQLNHHLPAEDIDRLTLYLLQDMEEAGWRLVPTRPTRHMVKASCAAMSPGKRKTERWVSVRQKHAWRLTAAIEAAPNWRAA